MPRKQDAKIPRKDPGGEKSPTPPLPVLAPPLGFGLGMSFPYCAAGGAAVGNRNVIGVRPDPPRLALATKARRKTQVSDDEVDEETEVYSPSLVTRITTDAVSVDPTRKALATKARRKTQVSDDEVDEETEVYSPSLLTRVTPTYTGDQDEKQEEGGEGEEEEEEEEEEESEEDEDEDATDDKKPGDKKPGDKKDEDKVDEVSVSPFDLADDARFCQDGNCLHAY